MADHILQFRLNQAIAGKQRNIISGDRSSARKYSAMEKSLRQQIASLAKAKRGGKNNSSGGRTDG